MPLTVSQDSKAFLNHSPLFSDVRNSAQGKLLPTTSSSSPHFSNITALSNKIINVKPEDTTENITRYTRDFHGNSIEAVLVSPQDASISIKIAKDAQASYSFANKKKINLLILDSDPIPAIHFSSFKEKDMIQGINIGWETFGRHQRSIAAAIERGNS